MTISTPALAGKDLEVQPLQVGQESVRYTKGRPTVDLEMHDGVVQITPLPMDHGSLSFSIAVYNDSKRPSNFGIENISITHQNRLVAVFSKDELIKKAKNRAAWAEIGLALVGGLAAGAAASQRDYYNSTWITPRGTYFGSFSAPSASGQLQATAITAGTVYGLVQVQNQLDRTIEVLGDQIVQLTTVDPGESYAGRIVIDKLKSPKLPDRVDFAVSWNGETYPFAFQVAKPGTPAPLFTSIATKSDLTNFHSTTGSAQTAIVQTPPAPTAQPGTVQTATSTNAVEVQQPIAHAVQTATYSTTAIVPASAANGARPATNPPTRDLGPHVMCTTCR